LCGSFGAVYAGLCTAIALKIRVCPVEAHSRSYDAMGAVSARWQVRELALPPFGGFSVKPILERIALDSGDPLSAGGSAKVVRHQQLAQQTWLDVAALRNYGSLGRLRQLMEVASRAVQRSPAREVVQSGTGISGVQLPQLGTCRRFHWATLVTRPTRSRP